ncbi:MAG TPA: O-antigen ligase family protein [Gammaproteobacteria bacterium]
MTDQTWGWWRHRPIAAAGPGISARQVPQLSQAGSTPFWALMAFTCLLLLSPQSFVPAVGALHLPLLMALLSAGSYILGRWRRREKALEIGGEARFAAWLAGWALLTIPISLWPGGSVAFFFGIYFKALVVFWLLSRVVDTTDRLRTVCWILSLIAAPLAVSGVRSFFSGAFKHEELSHGLARISGYDASLTGNPNDLALMLNLILPLSIALFLMARSMGARCLLAALIGLDVVAIIATFSRAGFLSLGIIGVTYLVIMFRRGRRNLALLIIACGMAGTALLPSAYINRLSTITNIQADKTNSAQTRFRDYLTAMKYVTQHPLMGAGVGMNILALNDERGATWTLVHNVYLEYSVDLGLPGLVLFLLLLRAIVRGLRKSLRRAAEIPSLAELHFLLEGLGVSLLGFMLSAFFYPDAYQFYFYYIAGLSIAAIAITASVAAGGVAQTKNQTSPT